MTASYIGDFCKDEAASALPEFALSAGVLFMVVFGILECSRALYLDHYVANAAREGTRYAMVRGATFNNAACSSTSTGSCTATPTDVTNYVLGLTPDGASANKLSVLTTWPGTTPTGASCTSSLNTSVKSPGCVVSVKVTYAFNFLLAFLPQSTISLTGSSVVTIAQ